ncbi:hypothetical protein PRZ48_002992 [Zasmidium cellare]|uniref:Conserved oligomeric Golgi complex subunit 1 n=1 Tax=Zasmidium cellare TaxID=395010 RepID=A0ABR0ETS2_ZASCE|nr:hypothetical protein PRZ48_002992 [Zasmidium cellare]
MASTTSTQPPDPKTLTSWEEAFTYPLPTVLSLEKSLRSTITDNRTKLRTLVGSSYRDLLGTAEKIITMDEDIRIVEENAGPREVLRYFLQVRFEQLEAKAEEGELVGMLDLYSQTLLDTKELFPRRFADALAALAKSTLVKDKDVRAVQELSLDVYEQWIEEDVRNFHPYVRHDQLSTTEVGDALAAWTRQAQECLLQGLRDALEKQTDVKEVLEVRQKVLSKYLALSARVRSDAHAKALEDIRSAFLSRLEELAAQAAKIVDFSVVDEQETSAASMWDLATTDLDLNNGAIQFRQAVIHRQHGHSPSITNVTTALDRWIERLQGFTEFISTMRTIKWDDDLDLELDDLTDGESLQVILSKKDPQLLEARLHQETTTALEHTYRQVEKSVESEHNPTILIRVVREVDRRRRGLGDRFDKLANVNADSTFIAALHRQVAASIVEEPVQQFSKSMQKRTHTPVTLWDGTPPLPVQPSPATFRFLKTLHKHMSSAGTDLWSPDAVQVLKIHVAEQVASQLDIEKIVAASEGSLSNGHADQDDKANGETSGKRDRLVQLLFDVLYLQRVFSSKEGGKLEEVVGEIGRRAELDDKASLERLRKSAMEYWRRTYLLFGLLAVGQSSQ